MTVVSSIVTKLFRNGIAALAKENGCHLSQVQIGFKMTESHEIEYGYVIDWGAIKPWESIGFKKATNLSNDLLGYEKKAFDFFKKQIPAVAFELEQSVLSTNALIADDGNQLMVCVYNDKDIKKTVALSEFIDGD